MRISFMNLPYPDDALEPFCSAQTVKFHYGKHHRGYFDKTAKAIEGTRFESMALPDIVRATAGDRDRLDLFRNAAQLWNHDLFWNSMKPKGGGRPDGRLADLAERDFGGFEALEAALRGAAAKHFGSGWAWLVLEKGKLAVTATHDADNPLPAGAFPLLALDVWEHAYYLDYQNRRPDFIEAYLGHLVDWQAAGRRLESAFADEAEAGAAAKRRASR